ncbi:MAG: metalloregulator ArsR/SmtB family transcription factor [Hyphomonadaceae bacterium]
MNSFSALSDPTRRRILEMLSAGDMAAGEIAEAFDMTAAAISQHLKALREAGLVTVRAKAQRRIYRLAPEGFDECVRWLEETRDRRAAAERGGPEKRASGRGDDFAVG